MTGVEQNRKRTEQNRKRNRNETETETKQKQAETDTETKHKQNKTQMKQKQNETETESSNYGLSAGFYVVIETLKVFYLMQTKLRRRCSKSISRLIDCVLRSLP